jgi:hypothetical protein
LARFGPDHVGFDALDRLHRPIGLPISSVETIDMTASESE